MNLKGLKGQRIVGVRIEHGEVILMLGNGEEVVVAGKECEYVTAGKECEYVTAGKEREYDPRSEFKWKEKENLERS